MKIFKSVMFFFAVSIAAVSFSDTARNAEAMIVEAEQANAAAKAIGFEWRDTGKYIADAKLALADGKEDTAFQLAQKAYDQAVLATEQGEFMKENWEQYIPL